MVVAHPTLRSRHSAVQYLALMPRLLAEAWRLPVYQ